MKEWAIQLDAIELFPHMIRVRIKRNTCRIHGASNAIRAIATVSSDTPSGATVFLREFQGFYGFKM
jgi:hypothetical protein